MKVISIDRLTSSENRFDTRRQFGSATLAAVFAAVVLAFLSGCNSATTPEQQKLQLLVDQGARVGYDQEGHVEFLNLSSTEADNDSLILVATLPHLKRLWLANTNITDQGLDQITQLSELKVLVLSDTYVSNVGLEKLKPLESLREIYLDGTRVNDNGVISFQESNPEVFIAY